MEEVNYFIGFDELFPFNPGVMRHFCLALLILIPTSGYAQSRVSVNGHAEGSVGKNLIYQVEREIEDHGDMILTDKDEEHIMTLEIRALPHTEGSDDATAYSVTWTVADPDSEAELFWGSTVGYAGYERVEDSARQLVRRTDESLDTLSEMANSGSADV